MAITLGFSRLCSLSALALVLSLPAATLVTVQAQTPSQSPASQEQSVTRIPVEEIWPNNPVHYALLTAGDHQFVAYYDRNRQVTVAQRRLGSTEWTTRKLHNYFGGWDSHNYLRLAIDRSNRLHLSGNMHNVPLLYWRADKPFDITTMKFQPMIGSEENRVTYPNFFTGFDGEMIFSHRNGGSGSGDTYYNVYDEQTRTWSRLMDTPMFDGESKRSVYPISIPVKGPDGYFHISWLWRDTPRAETAHTLGYIRSRDFKNWETVDGKPVALPIRFGGTDVIADPIPHNSGIVSSGSIGFDADNNVVLSYLKYDKDGNQQCYLSRFVNGKWVTTEATRWQHRREVSGVGSLPLSNIRLSVGPVYSENGRNLIRLSHSRHPSGVFEIDPRTWTVGDQPLPEASRSQLSTLPAQLRRSSSDFPGMMVRWRNDDGLSPDGVTYRLRWETLDTNRDRPRPEPWPGPQPGMLEVIEIRE